ncbi:MAG: hypothetical protein KC561_21000, partial [Myxococcales bacterium]|nr:hypothetical protein [Myxococcales bacterium]
DQVGGPDGASDATTLDDSDTSDLVLIGDLGGDSTSDAGSLADSQSADTGLQDSSPLDTADDGFQHADHAIADQTTDQVTDPRPDAGTDLSEEDPDASDTALSDVVADQSADGETDASSGDPTASGIVVQRIEGLTINWSEGNCVANHSGYGGSGVIAFSPPVSGQYQLYGADLTGDADFGLVVAAGFDRDVDISTQVLARTWRGHYSQLVQLDSGTDYLIIAYKTSGYGVKSGCENDGSSSSHDLEVRGPWSALSVADLLPALWFEAASLSGADLSSVPNWPDQGDNGWDVTAESEDQEPVFHASGGSGNSPFVRFDGIDDKLTSSV